MISNRDSSRPCNIDTLSYQINSSGGIVSKIASVRKVGTCTQYGKSDPDWRTKIAKRVDATNWYERYHYSLKPLEVSASYKVNGVSGGGYRLDSPRSFPYGNVMPIDNTIGDQALAKFKSEFSENYSSFQSLIPLAEIKETRGLIRSSAALTERMLRELIAIKRGRGNLARIRKLAADVWLQYSFAISPTVNDVKDLLSVISDHLTREDKVLNISEGKTKEWQGSYTETVSNWINNCHGFMNTTDSFSLGYRYTAGYNLDLRSGNDYSALDRFGLSLGALPSVLWELTVFSWVADYFGTIGAYLEDVFQSPPGHTIYLCISKKYQQKSITHCTLIPATGSVKILSQKCEPEVFTFQGFKRTPLAALPHRALRFKTSDEIGKNAIKKLLNLSSILVK